MVLHIVLSLDPVGSVAFLLADNKWTCRLCLLWTDEVYDFSNIVEGFGPGLRNRFEQ